MRSSTAQGYRIPSDRLQPRPHQAQPKGKKKLDALSPTPNSRSGSCTSQSERSNRAPTQRGRSSADARSSQRRELIQHPRFFRHGSARTHELVSSGLSVRPCQSPKQCDKVHSCHRTVMPTPPPPAATTAKKRRACDACNRRKVGTRTHRRLRNEIPYRGAVIICVTHP